MESKILKTGKQINLVIAEPEIFHFSRDDLDFAVLASDGVYDRLSNQQIIETVWETLDYYKRKYKLLVANRKAKNQKLSSKNKLNSSLTSNTSARLSSKVRKMKKASKTKSYSQVFDENKKKRNNSRSKKKVGSYVFNSQRSNKLSNANTSNTSIHLKEDDSMQEEVEPWVVEMRKRYEQILGECVNNILKRSLLNHSDDNVTLIMLVFKDLILI